jgi:hypothetical protein
MKAPWLSEMGAGAGMDLFAGPSGVDILPRLLQCTVRGTPPHFGVRRNPAQEIATKFSLRPGSSVVERGPEKAGVGGSIPSLATTYKH